MKKRMTLLGILAGTPLIWIIIFLFTFHTLEFSAWKKSYEFEVSKNILEAGSKDFRVVKGNIIALSEDPWIMISLERALYVEKIRMTLPYVKWKDSCGQIYYSLDKEITGDFYVEFELDSGIIEVFLPSRFPIKTLRLDLTSLEKNELAMPEISIVLGRVTQIEYLITCVALSLLWGGFVFVQINWQWLGEQIEKRSWLNEKWKLIEQVVALAWSDFKNRFSGSYLGIFWGIIQPISTIFLFWFVFQVGFRSQPMENVPFILWLAAGMIPWNYFYDAWLSGTMAFTSYGYIVKKVVFRIEYLPLVKALSSAILNLLFSGILLSIYMFYGKFPGIHILDMFYFSLCIMMFSLGLSYMTASLHVFIKDVGQFLGIILQFLMWMTPMMWQYRMIPEKYSWFYKLNPMHYVINGYRESLINRKWFFTHWIQMFWFWSVTIFLLYIGYRLMKKLKIHFADVL